jgi:hypothetical protein
LTFLSNLAGLSNDDRSSNPKIVCSINYTNQIAADNGDLPTVRDSDVTVLL